MNNKFPKSCYRMQQTRTRLEKKEEGREDERRKGREFQREKI